MIWLGCFIAVALLAYVLRDWRSNLPLFMWALMLGTIIIIVLWLGLER